MVRKFLEGPSYGRNGENYGGPPTRVVTRGEDGDLEVLRVLRCAVAFGDRRTRSNAQGIFYDQD